VAVSRTAEVEEETGEFDDDGNPKMKRRKADDEHLIRKHYSTRGLSTRDFAAAECFYGAASRPVSLFSQATAQGATRSTVARVRRAPLP